LLPLQQQEEFTCSLSGGLGQGGSENNEEMLLSCRSGLTSDLLEAWYDQGLPTENFGPQCDVLLHVCKPDLALGRTAERKRGVDFYRSEGSPEFLCTP